MTRAALALLGTGRRPCGFRAVPPVESSVAVIRSIRSAVSKVRERDRADLAEELIDKAERRGATSAAEAETLRREIGAE